MSSRSLVNEPVTDSLERGLKVYGGVYSIDDLRANFLSSPYAQAQRALKPRFSTYWWQDLDKFKDFFGPDVDPVEHGSYQARTVAIPLVRAQLDTRSTLFSDGIADHYVAHHVQHDDHEGMHALTQKTNHDVPYREKTDENEKAENKLWKAIHQELFGDTEKAREHFRYVDLFTSKDAQILATVWDIGERIGYLHSGLRAATAAFEADGLTDAERTQSRLMARRVIGRHLPIIENVSSWIIDAERVAHISQTAAKQVCTSYGISRKELYASEAA